LFRVHYYPLEREFEIFNKNIARTQRIEKKEKDDLKIFFFFSKGQKRKKPDDYLIRP